MLGEHRHQRPRVAWADAAAQVGDQRAPDRPVDAQNGSTRWISDAREPWPSAAAIQAGARSAARASLMPWVAITSPSAHATAQYAALSTFRAASSADRVNAIWSSDLCTTVTP
jgi:hypothetical protein